MLRLAVAVTNCVNAEETDAWDISSKSAKGWGQPWLAGADDKVPGQGRAVNAVCKTTLSLRSGVARARCRFFASDGDGHTNLCLGLI
jgi:hypothetical protein